MDRSMITDVDTYFTSGCGRCDRYATPECSAAIWADGQALLRKLCLDAGLIETAKWGHPCYMHAGRNVAILGAFRSNFRLTFFNASLLRDTEGVLEKQGANTQNPDMMYFTAAADVVQKSNIIAAYLREAMQYAEARILPAKQERALDIPDELIEAMDCDPELAEAFHALTLGRQKSWAFHLNSTQVAATRFARIARARDKILAGKGALER